MREQNNDNNHFVELLLVLLIILKITGRVSISWLWVFAPLWIPAVSLVVLLFLYFILFGSDV